MCVCRRQTVVRQGTESRVHVAKRQVVSAGVHEAQAHSRSSPGLDTSQPEFPLPLSLLALVTLQPQRGSTSGQRYWRVWMSCVN